MKRILPLLAFCLVTIFSQAAQAQQSELTVATVTRPPFSMAEGGSETGFSIELFDAIASDLGLAYEVRRFDTFSDMLSSVVDGTADAAIANISITASREETMDFSQPIFESGIQIMVAGGHETRSSLWNVLVSWELIGAILAAFALLFVTGLLMWALERKRQEYFDRPFGEAAFSSFWWALNLVVNGGFEERVPRSFVGRILAVLMVVGSLFIVSIFVARITAIMTIDAIESNVNSVTDLSGRQIATITGSTTDTYLANRNLTFRGFDNLDAMLNAFEAGEVEAVVFDAPVLAYYALNSNGAARLVGPVVQRENYGIALPSGSRLSEPFNQSLLRLREGGTYDQIYRKWFGRSPS